MPTEITNPVAPCIVCLNVSGDLIRYKGSCKCSPKIHTSCLNLWFEKNGRTCPICRVNYEPASHRPTTANINVSDNNGCACCCLTCILFLVFMPCCLH